MMRAVIDLQLSGDVADARVAKRPVVALESTLVAHGLPWPQNLEVARELETAVREHGAVPATIAVIDGRACIGVTAAALDRIARGGRDIPKAGATDLAVHLARGTTAATTVGATAILAAHAGLRVFATGGIGGVHRGDSCDVSNDLAVMARTPIAIVSAGAKAILDLPRTFEVLETYGVLVVGYQTDEAPAFYTQRSGIRLEHVAADARELAAIVRRHWEDLGGAGVLVCNPIPSGAALDPQMIDAAIESALAEAEARNITGKRLTPHLLARLAEVTGGASIRANRALALHNAEVAAKLAVALGQVSGL